MMEKINASYESYQRKIVSYLDGSLSADEVSEFEAFVRTHPDFEALIKNKENEMALLRQMIPSIAPSRESSESIETEMRASIFNLLKEEPKNLTDMVRIKIEDWINR